MISQEFADQLLAEVKQAREEINAATRRLGLAGGMGDIPSAAIDRELRAMDAAPELEPSSGETFDSYTAKVNAWTVANPDGELPSAVRMSLAILAFKSLFGFEFPFSDASMVPCESGEHALPAVIVSVTDLEKMMYQVIEFAEMDDDEITETVRASQ